MTRKKKKTALSAGNRLQTDVDLIKDLMQDCIQKCKDILQQREFKVFTQQSREFADKYRQYPHIKQLWANLVVPLVENLEVTRNQMPLPLGSHIDVLTAEKYNNDLYLLCVLKRDHPNYIIQKIALKKNCKPTVIYEEASRVSLTGLLFWNRHVVTVRNHIELLFINIVKHNATNQIHIPFSIEIFKKLIYNLWRDTDCCPGQVITCKGPGSTIFVAHLNRNSKWYYIYAVDLSEVFVSDYLEEEPVEAKHSDSECSYEKNLNKATGPDNFKWFSSIPFKLCAMFYLNSERELLVVNTSGQHQTRIDAYSYLPGEGFKDPPALRCDFRSAFYHPHLLHCQKLMLYFPENNCPDNERELHARDTRKAIADMPICMRALDFKVACWVESREHPTDPVTIGDASAAATMDNERSKMDILCSSKVYYISRRVNKKGRKFELHKLRICHLESDDRH